MIRLLTITTISLFSPMFIYTAPLKAQTVETIAPQKLIKLARQGRFKSQGIPSYSRLNSAIRSRKVNAQTLVSAAIEQKRLSKNALENLDYLSSIDAHLKSGGCGSL